jgi:hypothetical protein
VQSILLVALLAAASVVASSAAARGVCVEDKSAAVYDHAAVTRALGAKNAVAFFAIEGAIPPSAAALRTIAAMAASAPGVDKDSVRVSRHAASLVIAFDPGAETSRKCKRSSTGGSRRWACPFSPCG